MRSTIVKASEFRIFKVENNNLKNSYHWWTSEIDVNWQNLSFELGRTNCFFCKVSERPQGFIILSVYSVKLQNIFWRAVISPNVLQSFCPKLGMNAFICKYKYFVPSVFYFLISASWNPEVSTWVSPNFYFELEWWMAKNSFSRPIVRLKSRKR